jgi:hypothetical protein
MEKKKDVKVWDLFNPNVNRSTQELRDARLSICRGCERFEPVLERCLECGCLMKLKVTLQDASCPLGRW